MTATLGHEPACRCQLPATDHAAPFTGSGWEPAARRLGTLLRTYRRRVAELMATLEAGSRFQAGIRAGELGLAH